MHPSLSQLLPLDKIPNEIEAVRDALASIFNDIYVKNLIASQSYDGSSGFYSVTLTTYNSIGIDIPIADDLRLILNPTVQGTTEIPVSFDYSWIILKYIRDFNFDSFDNTVQSVLRILFDLAEIDERRLLNEVLHAFYPGATALEDFVQDFNNGYNQALTVSNDNDLTLEEKTNEISDTISDLDFDVIQVVYESIIEVNGEGYERLKLLFARFFDNIEQNLKEALQLNFNAIIQEISVGLQFPHKWLRPVYTGNEPVSGLTENDPLPDTYFSYLKFDVGSLQYSSTGGFQFNNISAFSLHRSIIGNTGLIAEFSGLKIDLYKDKNIPEADADGRDVSFMGVYAENVSITLPKKWFKQENGATLQISGKQMLIGTQGGISGTILLETIINQNPNLPFEYYNDKFSFNYPIVMLTESENSIVEESFADYDSLKAHLILLNSTNKPYVFKYPLSLIPNGFVSSFTFNNSLDYDLYLSSLSTDFFWNRIGSDNGFRVGFNKFDITFKQNKIISSNIKGALEIKKFVYPGTDIPVHIDLDGHLHDNGDFNLTASAHPAYPIELPGIFIYNLKSVELGKEGEDFYIGTGGSIEFQGFLKESLHLGPIDIDRLRIYSDGSIEIKGGSINLIKPILLPLGPVDITVTAIHYGSHQKEVDGVMRKFNYFGFDGGISIDPLGIEVRGDGVKLYYCSDNLPNKPSPYLHIQTLYIDLTIPASSPVAIINGWLTIPEPGTSPEYAGGIKIKLPKAKISGSADMKLMPKYPAFIIDAEIEFPAPIPLGSFAIYGFRGLLGYRYVAEKEAIGLVSGVNTWYEYYKAPPRGIHVRKFSGPNQTNHSGTPFSIGAGASLGTSYDNGTTLNIKAMVLLSVPSMFMIDGRASLISARLGLEDTKDPPFFAFLALGDNSLEFGFGADFKLPTSSGEILTLYADVQAAFFFNDSSKWYVNIGTRTTPVTARILRLITLQSYLMLSAKGIEAGARGEFIFEKTYGPVKVKAWAYVEVGGKISFERPQVGGYIAAGVGAEINIRILHVYIGIDLLFGSESPKPFLIYGKFRLCVRVKICFIKIKFCGQVEISWEFNKNLDRAPINPLINIANQQRIGEIVVGVNMLTNDTFSLAYLTDGLNANGIPILNGQQVLPDSIKEIIIPLDTYIDIKTEKGLLPGAISSKIGGVNNGPSRYTDLIPPDAVVKGKTMRQVKHQYLIEEISIMSWNGTSWVDYNPYKALYPDDGTLNNLKIGQWQKVDGQYNTIRLLATNPFSFTEQGEPGWHIPEQYGVTASSLFCESHHRESKCANFLTKVLGTRFYCYDIDNHFFFSNGVAFMLLNSDDEEFAEVTDIDNAFGFDQSLSFPNSNQLQIMLPQPASTINLKLSSFADGVKIKYYSAYLNIHDNQVQFRHPNPALNSSAPYEEFVPISHLGQPIEYSSSMVPGWKPITKIVIEPVYPNSELINALQEQIAELEEQNFQILLDDLPLPYQTTAILQQQLDELLCSRGSIVTEHYRYEKEDSIHTIVENNIELDWVPSWNYTTDTKYEENLLGIKPDINSFVIESDYEIVNVKLLPNNPNQDLPEIEVDYEGTIARMNIYDPSFFNGDLYNFEITYFNTSINPNCGGDPNICIVYHQIFDILAHDFGVTNPMNYSAYQVFSDQIIEILKSTGFDQNVEINEHYDIIDFYGGLPTQQLTVQHFNNTVVAIESVLSILNDLGNCKCGCDGEIMKTLLHEICWLALEDYEYNLNIPSQEAINADSQATIDGISKFIQPIWKPDTSYIVKFRLKDIVDNGFSATPYSFVYGFSTAGPVGFFHTHEHATYGDIKLSATTILDDTTGIVRDNNGVVVLPNQEPHPDKYPLTSLRHYIDYNRSYPNADGNLLSAKPLFYDDGDNTIVSLYFSKAYAIHFFQDWQMYNGSTFKSKLKIVIKDPREDVSISNPPSLDNVVTTVDIPQTIETWTEDDINPLVPFVTNQWINMFNANICIGTGQIIKPKSKYVSVELKQLKPSKLYTAIVNGVYDVYKDQILGPVPDPANPGQLIHQDEIRELHKFVFQTSRYKNFTEQIQSYILDEVEEIKAVFTIEKAFTTEILNAAFKTINGESLSGLLSDEILNRLNTNYQHAYDRIFEGILGFEPLDEAVTTEFNVIRNSDDANKVIAVIVRNPEPFNNPKMAEQDLSSTLKILLPDTSNPDSNYFVLFSKDKSQAIFMHNSLAINVSTLRIGFTYKLWNGSGYTVSPMEIAEISF